MASQALKKCLACRHDRLKPFLDLGAQPLANSFHRPEEKLKTYPLAVQYCAKCFHVQLTEAVDPAELFSNYLYVSGTTKTLTDYFADFVLQMEKRFGGKKLRVLELACNDGSLLEKFKERGHQVYGVDPAQNLQALSKAKGVEVLCDFWSEDLGKKLSDSGRQFDLVVAMNVVAHVSDPIGFMKGVREVIAPAGLAVIQTSQSEMILNGEFDTIYHEHHSFFNSRSFAELCRESGNRLIDIGKAPVHGTSYVWYVVNDDRNALPEVAQVQRQEEAYGYFEPGIYTRFAENTARLAKEVTQIIAEHRAKGFAIVGYGAAAKANTFLNYAKLPLDFIVDDNPMKVGLLSPGMNIPVKDSASLAQIRQPILFLILAWNFYDEVTKRIRQKNADSRNRFFRYFPEVKIETESQL